MLRVLTKMPSVGLLFMLLVLSPLSVADDKTLEAITIQRQGLQNVIAFMDNHPSIFHRPHGADLVLNRTEKETALDVWALYLDYMSTLDKLSQKTEDAEHPRLQQLHSLAFTTHYRYGLEFISRIKNDPELVKWYNLKHPEKGLPKNFYRLFSDQMLSDYTTDRFDEYNRTFHVNRHFSFSEQIKAEKQAINELSRWRLLTSNSAHRFTRSLYRTYYPIQMGVARGMGKIKVWRIGRTLITPEQALAFSRSFEPGDFYITRKEWRLTNVGIPGFWTHSALFIGTPAERARYFDTPEINAWVQQMGAENFEDLLKQVSPIYRAYSSRDALGDIRVIEALDAGVIFNSIETSLDADGAAVFRPKTTKLEKAKAIYEAFHFAGRPYDFHFDFDSDSALVCSELIYKAYLPSKTKSGIAFPLYRSVGKKMLTPNEIARWYDETIGTPEQKIDLVMFIDSNERSGIAYQSSAKAFIGTWKRPDWYIFKQSRHIDSSIASSEL